MRYTSAYGNGIESVDRRYRIMIGTLGYEVLSDEGLVFFVRQGDDGSIEIICQCESAVSRSVYDLVAFSIQDEHSITGTQLYSAIRMLCKKASGLWTGGIVDSKIGENF